MYIYNVHANVFRRKKNESLVQSKVLIKNNFNNFNTNILKNMRITTLVNDDILNQFKLTRQTQDMSHKFNYVSCF
jgi:hypothetical protein